MAPEVADGTGGCLQDGLWVGNDLLSGTGWDCCSEEQDFMIFVDPFQMRIFCGSRQK